MSYKLSDLQRLGKRIKEKRESITMADGRQMSQEDLAAAAKVRSSHISLIERSVKRDVFLTTVLKICNALDVKFDELIYG